MRANNSFGENTHCFLALRIQCSEGWLHPIFNVSHWTRHTQSLLGCWMYKNKLNQVIYEIHISLGMLGILYYMFLWVDAIHFRDIVQLLLTLNNLRTILIALWRTDPVMFVYWYLDAYFNIRRLCKVILMSKFSIVQTIILILVNWNDTILHSYYSRITSMKLSFSLSVLFA